MFKDRYEIKKKRDISIPAMQFKTDKRFILILSDEIKYPNQITPIQQRLHITSNTRIYFIFAKEDNLSANNTRFTESRSSYLTFIRVRLSMFFFNKVYAFSENNLM